MCRTLASLGLRETSGLSELGGMEYYSSCGMSSQTCYLQGTCNMGALSITLQLNKDWPTCTECYFHKHDTWLLSTAPASCPHACALVPTLEVLKRCKSSHVVQLGLRLRLPRVQAGPSCRCTPPASCVLPLQQRGMLLALLLISRVLY